MVTRNIPPEDLKEKGFVSIDKMFFFFKQTGKRRVSLRQEKYYLGWRGAGRGGAMREVGSCNTLEQRGL